LAEGAAGRGTTASDAIAPMFAKAYPNIGMGANEKILLSNKGRTMKKVHGNSTLSRRRIIKGAGVLAAGIAAPAFLRIRSAYAAYPERPVKIVVANTPGGPSDIVGRVVAATLQQSTGKTFIIENIGGAGSNIGMGHVARSDPDGYTILLATNAYSINATLYNKIPYDPLKDFVGVCELATSPNTFVVKSELPAKTMKEFVALARANPDKFNVATPPIGTTPQLQAEVLKIREKLPKLESVVFKGGGDALQALLSGTVQLSSGALPPAAPHIKAGTLRCLAVTGETRWPDLPDVPTMVEAGYKDFVFAVDTVLLAPAKTPPENIKWLEQETLKVLSTPEMKEKLYISGFQVRPKGADAAWARVNKEIDVFRDVINQAGIPKL
jgi:tripartite-type tricarboxylate transporter receptor subunit TctC